MATFLDVLEDLGAECLEVTGIARGDHALIDHHNSSSSPFVAGNTAGPVSLTTGTDLPCAVERTMTAADAAIRSVRCLTLCSKMMKD